MRLVNTRRVAYVLKMYPRFSETFIVNEILAHEAAGWEVEIFSLRPPADGRFHETLARVRAPVTYLSHDRLTAAIFWAAVHEAREELPGLWDTLQQAVEEGEEVENIYAALQLARLVRRRGIAHLHAHFGSVATTVARLASRFLAISYSFTAHAKDIFHKSVRPDDLRRKLRDAATTITVSDFNLAYLRETYGAAAASVQRVYNGLNLDHFRYASPAARPRRIVSVGRLIEKKGFEDLVAACALLARRGCEFECEIIGAGELEGALRAQIALLGLEGQVRLLGPCPQGEVMTRVQEAAAFAAPCVVGDDGNRDGLPTVLLEAMALGTPCISTDVTGIPEVLRHERTGLLVPQHDPAALADALERLLDDSALRLRLAEQARRRIESHFDIHHNAAQLRARFRVAAAPVLSMTEVV